MRLLSRLFALLLAGALAAGAGAWIFLDDYMKGAGPSEAETRIEIEKGWGIARIASHLAEQSVITEPLLFRLGARITSRDRALKAGEYVIPAAASPTAVLDILEEGKSLQYRIAVPEGLTTVEVLALIDAHPDLTGDLPEELPGEGTLLPETYFFERGEAKVDVIARMQEAMTETLMAAWETRQPDLPLETPEEALVLASIIEKETALPDEYGIVAGVFVNRLRKGMLLQTDPTVIYALTEGEGPLGRQLLRVDLQVDHPYNTYVYPGLPPGPIANAGKGAIEAALQPAETEFIYFVADGTGGHAFARTLDEHNRNVAAWRRVRDGG